jgi:hypothetical protein
VLRPTTTLVLGTTLALLLGACGQEDPPVTVEPGDEVDGALDGTEDAGEVDGGDDAGGPADGGVDAGSDGSVAADLDAQVAAAIEDLAATEGVSETNVEVVTAEEVTWSDGSLGCPDPDGMYTQALVPGYRIVLAVDGDEVHYHGADGQAPFRCDDPVPPAEDET